MCCLLVSVTDWFVLLLVKRYRLVSCLLFKRYRLVCFITGEVLPTGLLSTVKVLPTVFFLTGEALPSGLLSSV